MARVAHVIGNGDGAHLYQPAKGIKITCNLPPMAIEGVYTTCMVDFKMMKAINEGSVEVPGDWTLGFRPKKWCEMHPEFHMKYARQIKYFYLDLPPYARNYTDFNCGHFAVHMTANRIEADEIHMYGFDSMFDHNMRSCTDVYLESDRSLQNNTRLMDNWRPIWMKLFDEFKDTQFFLHHDHDAIKFPKPNNVEIITP